MFRTLEAEIRAAYRIAVWVLVGLVVVAVLGVAAVDWHHSGPAVQPCPPRECPLNSSAP